MEYTLKAAERLAEELRALPPKDPFERKVNKEAMVRHLAREILALEERGYTIEEVADSLRGRGLDITTPRLKIYLQRTTGADRKSRTARPRSGKAGQATAVPTVPPVPEKTSLGSGPKPGASSVKAALATSPEQEAPLRAGKDAFLVKDKDSY